MGVGEGEDRSCVVTLLPLFGELGLDDLAVVGPRQVLPYDELLRHFVTGEPGLEEPSYNFV